jgi:hypothetical protein
MTFVVSEIDYIDEIPPNKEKSSSKDIQDASQGLLDLKLHFHSFPRTPLRQHFSSEQRINRELVSAHNSTGAMG